MSEHHSIFNELETQFLVKSRKQWIRRRLITIGTVAAILLITTIASIVSYSFNLDAQEGQRAAQDSARVAIEMRRIAQDSALAAQNQREIAIGEQKRAEDSANVAIEQRQIAQIEAQRANDSAVVAKQQREFAQREQKRAEDSANAAIFQRQIAQQQQQLAEENARQANLLTAKTLASQALNGVFADVNELAALAIYAYNLHIQNKGSLHDSTLYQALNKAKQRIYEDSQTGQKGLFAYNYISNGTNRIDLMAANDLAIYFYQGESFIRQWRFKPEEKTWQAGQQIPILEAQELRRFALGNFQANYQFLNSPNSDCESYQSASGNNESPSLIALGYKSKVNIKILTEDISSIANSFITGDVLDIVFKPDNSACIVTDRGKKVYVYDIQKAIMNYKLSVSSSINSFAIGKDGKYLIGTNLEGKLVYLELIQGAKEKILADLTDHEFQSVSKHPYKEQWAIGSREGKIFLLSSPLNRECGVIRNLSNQCITELENSHNLGTGVNKVGFSPTGEFIVSAGDDRTLHVWRIESSNTPPIILRDFVGEGTSKNRVLSLAFLNAAPYLLAGDEDGVLSYWPLTMHEFACSICEYLGDEDVSVYLEKYLPENFDFNFQPPCTIIN